MQHVDLLLVLWVVLETRLLAQDFDRLFLQCWVGGSMWRVGPLHSRFEL